MNEKDYLKSIKNLAEKLYIHALINLPDDVKDVLNKAYLSETSESGKVVLKNILESVELAKRNSMLLCQDTGIPVYYIGLDPEIALSMEDVKKAVKEGCSRATVSYPLRQNTVHPLTRENSGTNTGHLLPHVNFFENKPGEGITVMALPKGSGSENMSFVKMLAPADGIAAVKKFVLECVVEAGAKPCPPTIIGVGMGGTSDLCMSLAKKAVTRKVGSGSDDPDVARLEKELFADINSLGIGPMGLGGSNTTLGVNVEYAHTHISMNPVAVNFQCWVARRASARILKNGQVLYE